MSKITLITGLDGSGKSTLLARLLENRRNKSYEIIFAPHFDTENLAADPMVFKTAQFINKLSSDADRLKYPHWKAIALFASMLLFKKVLEITEENYVKTIFCERHPLIDTAVYGRFYAGKLSPDSLDEATLTPINKKYNEELDYLLRLLPNTYISSKNNGQTQALLAFIYQWFYIEKKYALSDLQSLFGLDLPDRIFFLKADPAVLCERLQDRPIKEAHETLEILTKLDFVYAQMFSTFGKKLDFNQINANKIEELDLAFEKIYAYEN